MCLVSTTVAVAQSRDELTLTGDMTPAQVQRLFDAYELVRAREMLDLDDEQYPQFVASLNALQKARRETQQQRQRMLRELNRLARQPGTEESILEERLERLRAHDRESADVLEQAYDGIDDVLNVRQRVRFRMFERQMERRRLEMLQRARRRNATPQPNNRPQNR